MWEFPHGDFLLFKSLENKEKHLKNNVFYNRIIKIILEEKIKEKFDESN